MPGGFGGMLLKEIAKKVVVAAPRLKCPFHIVSEPPILPACSEITADDDAIDVGETAILPACPEINIDEDMDVDGMLDGAEIPAKGGSAKIPHRMGVKTTINKKKNKLSSSCSRSCSSSRLSSVSAVRCLACKSQGIEKVYHTLKAFSKHNRSKHSGAAWSEECVTHGRSSDRDTRKLLKAATARCGNNRIEHLLGALARGSANEFQRECNSMTEYLRANH
jgi:hypothetical protein